jgi:hypothetical protein
MAQARPPWPQLVANSALKGKLGKCICKLEYMPVAAPGTGRDSLNHEIDMNDT